MCPENESERVRSWSNTFLITNLKRLAKKLSAGRPEKETRKKKEKKTRMGIAKLFALNANRNNHINKCIYDKI